MITSDKSNIRAALRGQVIVPMISPVLPDGEPDLPSSYRLADHIVNGGCQGLLISGTNGEGPSFTTKQRIAQLRALIAHVGKRGYVYAGIGATSFIDAVEIGRESLKAGAIAVVAHPPPCFIINAAEIEAYYIKLVEAIGGPFFIYNMPLTTGISIPLDVIDRLSRHPLLIGVKDSEGNPERQEQLAAMHKDRKDFTVFCGAIAHSLRCLAAGADGNVPSAGNLDPAACRKLVDLALAGSPDAAAAQQRVSSIGQVYQAGRQLPGQVAALKACASIMGLCAADTLTPLLTVPVADRAALAEKLATLGLAAASVK